jgi:regulator of G-protein signaling
VELTGGEELALGGESLSNFLSQNLSELRASMKAHQSQRRHNVDISAAEARCLVGYLGTIERPEGEAGGREGGLQEIRSCIRRLRVEQKVHTLVLLVIFPARIVLINHHGLKLAEFPADSIRCSSRRLSSRPNSGPCTLVT